MRDTQLPATVAMPPSAREALKAQRQEAASPPPQWRLALLYIAVWTTIGMLFVGPGMAQALADEVPIPWLECLSGLLDWYLWGALFPLIWWLSRRFPLTRRKLFLRLPITLAGGLVITLLYLVLRSIKHQVLPVPGSTPMGAAPSGFPGDIFSGIEYFLLIYFAQVAFIHALTSYKQLRDREVEASRLEAQLALAHLEVLKTQLHPHFLFNTLNAISALMHRDVDAADRMISMLSDLLRLSLDNDQRHQVSLREELEFLDRYLAIEKIRFRDRLDVEIEVEDSCWDAMLPRLILQPLVENSIRHGIAMRSAAGKVAIRARREDDGMRIVVWDDGPGIPRGPENVRFGVGLSNTQARLQQTYGDAQVFELRNAVGGGFEVALWIPFETATERKRSET